MGRRISAARVKTHRSYTVEEAAEAVNATSQTIRSWIKQGLHALSETRPTLILGCALKAFIEERRAKRKR
ncbi:MAG: DNA-binding protein, partial [Roseibium sp.]|nr:DNA-binding protein [Roseibium sp.]